MRTNPISSYATIGLICGGTASTVQTVVAQQSGPSTVLATLLGTITGAVVGALYGYLKLRHAAKR